MAKILIASDHAGFHLKEELKKHFKSEHEFIDFGPNSSDSVDYPDYAHILSQKISESKNSFGLLICGSGIGMSMVANRQIDVRGAVCFNEKLAHLSREHKIGNVLVLGSRLISCEEAIKCLIMFFKSKFEGNRHQARLDKFNDVKM